MRLRSLNVDVHNTAAAGDGKKPTAPEQPVNIDRIKASAARKWVDAVNNWGELGLWDYAMIKNLSRIEDVLERYTRK